MKRKNFSFITGFVCSCIVLCLIAGFLYAGRSVETKDGIYNPVSERAMLSSQITPSVALNQDKRVCLLPNPDNLDENMEIAYETERNLKYGRVLKLDTEKLDGKQLRFAVLKDNRLKALDTFGALGWGICEGDVFTYDGERFTAKEGVL